jgi:predicted house-cleaning noncanonical NTP pyrophosphatase (MazG superfamily)
VLCLQILSKDQSETPLFFELPVEYDETFQRAIVGEFMEDGFIAPVSIELVSDEGNPLFYSSSIRTTVCDDEICELMYIKMYWDLVGDYVGFDTVASHPLTKFDHKPFGGSDYQRLHQLLKNEGSILKFKQKSELIDKKVVKASDVVDGTTGATAVEIREEVVEGALYSSYTLWHLAHSGKVKNRITDNTAQLMSDRLMTYLLNSTRSGYRLFAFHNFQAKDYEVYMEYWLNSLNNDMPLTRRYILKNIPEDMWEEHTVQNKICELFANYDVNTRTYLLNKIEESRTFSSKALEQISEDLAVLNSNQIAKFMDILGKQEKITKGTKENIIRTREDKNFKYSYIIDEYDWGN